MIRLLAIAAAVAVAIGACAAPAPRPPTPLPAAPTPLPAAPTRSAQPLSAAPSLGTEPVAMPPAVWGDWEAETTSGDAIAPNDAIQLSLNWQDGLAAWVQTRGGDLVLESTSTAANPGEIRLVTTDSVVGCAVGDVGDYEWDRSADGMFLTLTPIKDSCSLRATTMGRTWVHSLSAVNDGGRGVAGYDATFEVTLPKERFAMSGPEGVMDIHSDAGYELVTVRDPAGYREPCSTGAAPKPLRIEPTVAAFEAYVRGLPGLTVDTTALEVDGHPAAHLAITLGSAVDCPAGEVSVYRPDNSAADADFAVKPGSPLSLWVVEAPSGLYVFQYGGSKVTPAGEEQVVSTIRFIERLPTS